MTLNDLVACLRLNMIGWKSTGLWKLVLTTMNDLQSNSWEPRNLCKNGKTDIKTMIKMTKVNMYFYISRQIYLLCETLVEWLEYNSATFSSGVGYEATNNYVDDRRASRLYEPAPTKSYNHPACS